MHAFGQNPNPDFESKNGFFCSFGEFVRRIFKPMNSFQERISWINPNLDILDWKSKHSIGNGLKKVQVVQQYSANNLAILDVVEIKKASELISSMYSRLVCSIFFNWGICNRFNHNQFYVFFFCSSVHSTVHFPSLFERHLH